MIFLMAGFHTFLQGINHTAIGCEHVKYCVFLFFIFICPQANKNVGNILYHFGMSFEIFQMFVNKIHKLYGNKNK